MDIEYLDGSTSESKVTQAPRYEEPPPPPPNAKAPCWFRCENPECSQYGHVGSATAKDTPSACPQCKQPMKFLVQGPMPAGHQRIGLPDYGDDEMRGAVGFGRKRIVSN